MRLSVHCAASNCSGKSYHIGAKPVKVLGCGKAYAAYGEGYRAYDFYYQQEQFIHISALGYFSESFFAAPAFAFFFPIGASFPLPAAA